MRMVLHVYKWSLFVHELTAIFRIFGTIWRINGCKRTSKLVVLSIFQQKVQISSWQTVFKYFLFRLGKIIDFIFYISYYQAIRL